MSILKHTNHHLVDDLKLRLVAPVLVLLMSTWFLSSISATRVSADLMMTSRLGTGLTLLPAPDASMPFADVDIMIISSRNNSTSVRHDINVTGSFVVYSNITQNVTLAFVYPCPWVLPDPEPSEPWTDLESFNVNISNNGVKTGYEWFTWDDLTLAPGLSEPEWDWLRSCRFIVFEAALQEDVTIPIEISLHVVLISSARLFGFRYYVGTARSWDGDTHEIVRIRVEDKVPFIDYYFYPKMNLSVSVDGSLIVATWNSTISQFEEEYVEFYCTQPNEIPSTPYQPPPPTLLDLFSIAVIAVAIVLMIWSGRNIVRALSK